MNKHNEHVMQWMRSLAAEAKLPETSMPRIIEIFKTIAQYATHQ
jgi:hypothetical protein